MTSSLRIHTIFLLAFLLTAAEPAAAQNAPQSPSEFLGYELGTQWTPHHRVADYFRHVASSTSLATLRSYGETNEGRELLLATLSSPGNMERIEQIRTDNLKRAGLMEGDPAGEPVGIVWLSYNVHGDETSSSEAAMKTIYELVRPDNGEARQWLGNTVVIMDPMVNPDGRDRYVNWYRQVAGDRMNVDPDAREHDQPWPGGRTNHYYFDLNRDWAWLTQKESRLRVAEYQEWLPHIHVDFHEQSYNDPYYFAPGAEPFHLAITEWQREFQYIIGRNHARYFDRNDWLYFTREVFDLFYPSYGDTYPIFNGAIGMTYEQGGGGSAGLGVIRSEGDTLTLTDRLTHHHTTGLSTVEVASEHSGRMIEEFASYYETAQSEPRGEYKTYVIRGDANPDQLRSLLELLDRHRVRWGKAPGERSVTGYNYRTGETEEVEITADDYLVSAYQPKSVMARILFEPRPELTDSLTYDITTWEQHYAFGVEGYALESRIDPVPGEAPAEEVDNRFSGTPYAYLARWEDLDDVRMLAELLKNDVSVRYASESFSIEGEEYAPGSLVITRNGNSALGERFDRLVQRIATRHGEQLQAVSTGFVDSGPDFGSSAVEYLERPRVLLLSGEGTSSGSVGEIWHFFDRQIDYPVTLVSASEFGGVELDDYDVLILPSGYYGGTLSGGRMDEIREWVSGGGRLVAVEGANGFLEGEDGFALREKPEEEGEEPQEEVQAVPYTERQREYVPSSNAGSVFRVAMDSTHPLGYGYGEEYFSLKLDSDAYEYLDQGWNVGVTREGSHMSGFVGHEAEQRIENTLTFGVQGMGGGSVVYMVDNPLFRAFWHNGKLLFANAVFMVE